MSNLVRLGVEYIPKVSQNSAVGAGSLYIGDPDTDPTIIANQKTIYALQEDGTLISISQPVTLSAGGIPLYSGSPVSLYTNGGYSLTVLDSNSSQVYYVPHITVDFAPGNYYYYPDYNEADQGVEGFGSTIKKYVDDIGTTNKATLYFRHNSGSEFTDYILGTAETIPSNISLEFEYGARIKPAAGITLTVYSPDHILASPRQQIIDTTNNSTNPLLFTAAAGKTYVEWFGTTPAAVKSAINSAGSLLIPVHFSTGTYTLTGMDETFTNSVIIEGEGIGNTILSAATRWTFTKSLELRDLKIDSWTSNASDILMAPGASATIDWIKIKNVHWYNSAEAAMRVSDDQTITINELRINNSWYQTIPWYGIRAQNIIKFADISHNIFEDFGNTVDAGGFCVFLSDNSLQADTEFINVHHNKFYDISGYTDVECHAVLIYGKNVSINDNIVRGITADGEDAEAIYTKGSQNTISNNIVIDGVGENSDGAIVFKGEANAQDNVMANNIILNTSFEAAIYCNSGCIISNNFIKNGNIQAYLTDSSGDDRYTIVGNQIEEGQLRVKGLNRSLISGNSVYTSQTYAFYMGDDADGDACEDTLVVGNNFIVYGGVITNSAHIDDATTNCAFINNFLKGGTSSGIREASNLDIVKNNTGFATENGGAAANVSDGGTIAHGLAATPTYAIVQPSVTGDIVTVSGLNAANITVAIKDEGGGAGTQQTIYWRAYYVP